MQDNGIQMYFVARDWGLRVSTRCDDCVFMQIYAPWNLRGLCGGLAWLGQITFPRIPFLPYFQMGAYKRSAHAAPVRDGAQKGQGPCVSPPALG